MRRFYKVSKTRAREFAQKMDEIAQFCATNGIHQSASGDSYYFTIFEGVNAGNYRISNHTVEASNRAAFDDFGNQTRELYHKNDDDAMIYITAGKTRIIDIYSDLCAGYKLNKRGQRI